MITDLLGSPLTLELHGTGNIELERRAFLGAFPIILEALDIAVLGSEAFSSPVAKE